MDVMAWIFGSTGMVIALVAYTRVGVLEKKLKESGILDKSFDSEKEAEKNQ